MLFTYVCDFFIQNIFGGIDSNGNIHEAFFGQIYDEDEGGYVGATTWTLDTIDFNNRAFGHSIVSLGNYLSLIATIISMVAIFLICCALIKKIYNMCAHIIG